MRKILFNTLNQPTKTTLGKMQVIERTTNKDGAVSEITLGFLTRARGIESWNASLDHKDGEVELAGPFDTRSQAGHWMQRSYYSKHTVLPAPVLVVDNDVQETAEESATVAEAQEEQLVTVTEETAAPRLLTKQEAAEALGCSLDALRKRIKRGTVQMDGDMVVMAA